jgi:hypothetical protein
MFGLGGLALQDPANDRPRNGNITWMVLARTSVVPVCISNASSYLVTKIS